MADYSALTAENSIEPGPISGYQNPILCRRGNMDWYHNDVQLFGLAEYDPSTGEYYIQNPGLHDLSSPFNDWVRSIRLLPVAEVILYEDANASQEGGYKMLFESDPESSGLLLR